MLVKWELLLNKMQMLMAYSSVTITPNRVLAVRYFFVVH